MHELERKVNVNGNLYINFFQIADDDEPFHVQWYGGENIICDHDKSSKSDDQCAKSDEMYIEEGELLQFSVCNYWFREECIYE